VCFFVLKKELNVFKDLHRHYYFLVIIILTILAQVLIVEFGNVAFQTVKLSFYYWLLSIGIGAFTLIVGLFIRLLPDLPFIQKKQPSEPKLVTYEKLRWEEAISQVQTRLRVVKALRREYSH
jgi:Ca2+-transporting ATPase